MSKEWAKFQSDFPSHRTVLKGKQLQDAEKLRDKLVKDLQAAWDKEDDLRDAIKEAKEKRVLSGAAPDDFKGDAKVKTALKTWQSAVAAYRKNVKPLEAHGKAARKVYKPMQKSHDALRKSLKSDKPAASEKKAIDNALSALDNLQKAGGIFGTLKVHEVFYALKMKPSIEQIFKDVLKSASSAELPKVLEEAGRRKALNTARAIEDSVRDLCSKAMDIKADEPRKAKQSLKLAEKRKGDLGKINDSFQSAKTKEAKQIEAAKDRKSIEDAIAKIADYMENAEEMCRQTKKELK